MNWRTCLQKVVSGGIDTFANPDPGEEVFAFMSIRQDLGTHPIVTDIPMLALCSHRGAGLL